MNLLELISTAIRAMFTGLGEGCGPYQAKYDGFGGNR